MSGMRTGLRRGERSQRQLRSQPIQMVDLAINKIASKPTNYNINALPLRIGTPKLLKVARSDVSIYIV